MNYAWVIDQTRCIGCHACSTACKSENDVPLGVYRTWVKNVEVGSFPNVRRHFAVLRCNHCADPPCVHICPVSAMHQRKDGIVDIDHARCIGCKACMQACPYDAIHIDPTDSTVAKCHFCAHRVDQGLLPACVVICPVEALIFGDLDDPTSRVNRMLGSNPVTVRRPEQNTRPKAFYIGAHQATLDPLTATYESSYMWADRTPGTAKDQMSDFNVWSLINTRRGGEQSSASPKSEPATSHKSSTSRRKPQSRMPKARVAYDVQHQITWKWKVSAYLWTKSIAAGAVFVAALGMLLGWLPTDPVYTIGAPIAGLFALGVTGVLLIADLKRPERFWYILVKPQWRSWLTKGAYIITGYGGALTLWLGLAFLKIPVPGWLLAGTTALAFGTAVYTAFLFAQCEARDLWQSPVLGVTLTVQMLIAGAATLLVVSIFTGNPPDATLAITVLSASLMAHLATVFLGEVTARHGSSNAAAAAHVMTHGRYAGLFWGSIVLGSIVPILLLLLGPTGVVLPSAALALAGLLAYEHAFVMSGQSVPIS